MTRAELLRAEVERADELLVLIERQNAARRPILEAERLRGPDQDHDLVTTLYAGFDKAVALADLVTRYRDWLLGRLHWIEYQALHPAEDQA